MTDRELVLWALFKGWGWRASLKQLVDPGGIDHKVSGWDDIGEELRAMIIQQIKAEPAKKPSLSVVEDDLGLPRVN